MTQPSGEEHEPRFAGSLPAGYVAPPPASFDASSGSAPTYATSPWATETAAPIAYVPPAQANRPTTPPPAAPPALLDPEVSYADDNFPAEGEPGRLDLRSAPALAVAAAGGALAIVSSQLTWATLKLDSGPDVTASGLTDIKYGGSTLLEGRILLVLGIAAILISVAALLRRPLTNGLWLAGTAGVITAAFAAISHPADLATLLRSNDQVSSVSVSVPNGAGVWLALAGGALILLGGLVARLNLLGHRPEHQPAYPTDDTDDVPGE